MTVHILPSARHQAAEANLVAFIERARSSAALGPVDFDEPVWTVSLVKKKRASSARSGVNRLYFTEAKPGARSELDREPLREPFASFLKAIVRLREYGAPRHLDEHAAMIRAGRYLHAEIEAISYDPTLLLSDHFERAARAASAVDAPSTAYAVGKKLVEIAGWANRYNTARVQIDFTNPNQRVDDTNARLGKEAEERRSAKLPSEASLDALARLANMVTEDVDVLRMRTIELLVCGGWRINELLSIPADCEVEEQAYENGEPVLGSQGEPVIRYGIRYWGEKGAPPLPKWIPTPLVDVAKRAINDIRRITQPTRDAVAFMQRHPWGVLATGLADGDPDELITMRELAAILGVVSTGGQQWCRNWQVPLQKMGATLVARRRDIARVIRSDVPELPPDSPLELGEYLFLTPVNFTHPQRATIPGSVRFLTDGMVAGFITGKEKAPSAFERFGMVEEDGAPIRMNTHQFRHWLNTLAQQGGMSQLEIARWSGRKDVAQNAAYDHVTGAQLASRIRDLVEAGDIRGPIGMVSARLPPLDRDTFLEAEIPTAHVTDIGICVHDWSLLPCTNHGACAGCEEHLVLKGDEKQRTAAQRLASELRALVDAAEAEDADGTYGADRWVTAQKRVLSGVESILAVHADASIPDGTVVQLPSTQASN